MSVYGCNMNLELQQRAVEYNVVLRKYENMREGLFEQMPAIELKSTTYANTSSSNLDDGSGMPDEMNGDDDDAADNDRQQQERAKEEAAKTLIDIFSDDTFGSVSPPPAVLAKPEATTNKPSVNDMDDIFKMPEHQQHHSSAVAPVAQPSKNPLNDLDSLFSSSSTAAASQPPPTSSTSGLDDLLGLGGPSNHVTQSPPSKTMNSNDILGLFSAPSPSSSVTPSPVIPNGLANLMPAASKSTKSFTAYEKNDLKIVFETVPGRPSSLEQCYIQVKADNLSISNFVKDFEFSAAVPKTMQIQITPPTSSSMQPLESLALGLAVANPKKVRRTSSSLQINF